VPKKRAPGIHPGQQHLGIGRIKHPEQVSGVVGIHLLEHVGRVFGIQLGQRIGLIQLGQLLQNVGKPVVVERLEHLVARLGRQCADGVGHVDWFSPVELLQHLGHPLTRQRQRRRGQPLHALPVHDMHRAAPSKPSVAANGHPGHHHPVPGSGLLDSQVGDHDVEAGQLRQFRVFDLDRSVEHLTYRQDLARPLSEVTQGHVAGVERHRIGLDRGDPQNRNEDAAAGGQIDNQPQDPRLLTDEFSPSGPSTNIRVSRATYTLLTAP
jgi:hypothetical protein